jgi:hypothetical protein
VRYETLTNGETVFGVSDGDCICWLGAKNWQISTDSGRDLGWTLWRAFLDAGGPRPTEFHLQASPDKEFLPSAREGYFRQGIRCRQWWQRMESPDRPAWV